MPLRQAGLSAASRVRARSATARTNNGESFNDSARYSFIPRSSANLRNRISTSNRISTWSQTKPMGCTNTPVWPARSQAGDRVLHCGTQPFAARHALALKGELPGADLRNLRRDQRRRLARLRLVGIAFGDGSLRHAVRGEQHRQRRPCCCAGAFQPVRSLSAKASISSGWSCHSSTKSMAKGAPAPNNTCL